LGNVETIEIFHVCIYVLKLSEECVVLYNWNQENQRKCCM